MKLKKFIRNIYFRIASKIYISRKLNSTVTEKIGEFTFKVYPTVLNPVDFHSGTIFADFVLSLGSLKGKNILDMGTGSGIISIFAASSGADCTAVDINPMAVRSAKENASLNRLDEKINVIESDLFDAVKPESKYDLMFFNPPYYKGVPKDNFERALKGGKALEIISDFLSQAKSYLPTGGKIYFITSSDMDIPLFEKMLTSNGYRFEHVKKIKKFFETFIITEGVV